LSHSATLAGLGAPAAPSVAKFNSTDITGAEWERGFPHNGERYSLAMMPLTDRMPAARRCRGDYPLK